MRLFKILLFIVFLLSFSLSFSQNTPVSDRIIGTWFSEDKDLKVEIFKKNGHFLGKVVWFICDPKTPNMEDFKDIENPNPNLRNRSWLGMLVVENLLFNGKDTWENGSIYDPNTGRTYNSVVKLKDINTLVVRGYWGFEIFGKNLVFHRVE
ncbi:hypothetical protein EMA8858_01660 [Emticicia aquatica]|uniref:DUF2147 domain-containing protein n=1 Tax=Emticicia aquatica TaxID=1681835 RepID=A0ABM9ANV0_9BACT|nr:DUF2147 domain-containing protein [Emticicia aquatica]CAH0995537.1 hypothetical protein EMA8858_01660 [Emticicia aquatica]